MKVLVLNGSPKKKSDTMILTNAFLKGLNESGEHEITVINVIEKNIAPCRGCFGCWKIGNGRCCIDDDQNEILKLYAECDLAIWSFPLYCYSMPSHLKAVLDRVIPLVSAKMEISDSDGRTYHPGVVDFSKKFHMVISGCGFPNYEHNFEGLDLQMKNNFGNLTTVYVPETPLMNISAAKPVADIKASQFEIAGKEYSKNRCLSDETKRILESLMIPKEDYMAAHNQNW